VPEQWAEGTSPASSSAALLTPPDGEISLQGFNVVLWDHARESARSGWGRFFARVALLTWERGWEPEFADGST
jgi:hypothetical protein